MLSDGKGQNMREWVASFDNSISWLVDPKFSCASGGNRSMLHILIPGPRFVFTTSETLNGD